MATIKNFSVSISANGKVKVHGYFDKIPADSKVSAMRRAVSKVCTSGELSPRVCALLKEAVRSYDENRMGIYKKFRGVEVYGWVSENYDQSKSE